MWRRFVKWISNLKKNSKSKNQTSRELPVENPPCIKVLLLGDSFVGKSSIMLRYCEDKFDGSFLVTIGVDFRMKDIDVGDRSVAMQVWDSAGQERMRSITPAYYRSAMAVIFVYDVTNKESLKNIRSWCKSLTEQADSCKIAKFIVGNKIDLPKESWDVTEAEINEISSGITHMQVSAKSGERIEDVFQIIARDCINLHKL